VPSLKRSARPLVSRMIISKCHKTIVYVVSHESDSDYHCSQCYMQCDTVMSLSLSMDSAYESRHATETQEATDTA